MKGSPHNLVLVYHRMAGRYWKLNQEENSCLGESSLSWFRVKYLPLYHTVSRFRSIQKISVSSKCIIKKTSFPRSSLPLLRLKNSFVKKKTLPTQYPALHQPLPHIGPSGQPGRSILSTPLSRFLLLHFSCQKCFRPPRWGPAGGVRRESRQIRNRDLSRTLGVGIGGY